MRFTRWILSLLLALTCLGCGQPEHAPNIAVEGGSPIKLYNVAVIYGGNTYSFGVIGEFGAEMAFGPIAANDQLLIQWSEETLDNPLHKLNFTELLAGTDDVRVGKIAFRYIGSGQWSGMLVAPDETVICTMEKTLKDVGASEEGE